MNEREAAQLATTISADCIAVRVRLLNRVITNLYDRALQHYGIKVNQATILVMLSRAGGAGPGDIGNALLMEKSTVSRNIERMRKKGWIRVDGKDEGPSQVITVTQKGRDLMSSLYSKWKEAQREAGELLGDEGISAVRKMYDSLTQR